MKSELDGPRGVKTAAYVNDQDWYKIRQANFHTLYDDVLDRVIPVYRKYITTKYPNGVQYQPRKSFITTVGAIRKVMLNFVDQFLPDGDKKDECIKTILGTSDKVKSRIVTDPTSPLYKNMSYVSSSLDDGAVTMTVQLGEELEKEPNLNNRKIKTNAYRIVTYGHETGHTLSSEYCTGKFEPPVDGMMGEIESLFFGKLFLDYLAQNANEVAEILALDEGDQETIAEILMDEKLAFESDLDKASWEKLLALKSTENISGFDRMSQMRYAMGEFYAKILYASYKGKLDFFDGDSKEETMKAFLTMLNNAHKLTLDDVAQLITNGKLKTCDEVVDFNCAKLEESTKIYEKYYQDEC